jgi:alkylmercury lyase
LGLRSPIRSAAYRERDDRRPVVQRDPDGAVVAFSGLSLRATAHQFTVAGRRLYAWCARDALFLPALLGQPARVRSRCPATGATVTLTVDPTA